MLDITTLRAQHPVFTYHEFSFEIKDELVVIQFHFSFENGPHFHPKTMISAKGFDTELSGEFLKGYIFNLGLIEALSFWKAACSPHFRIECGSLTEPQRAWWNQLFIHGLGEFFYQNKIDFTISDFVLLESSGPFYEPLYRHRRRKALVLASGGKDSVVTTEILEKQGEPLSLLLVNPTKATLEVTQGKETIVVNRMLDPQLFELNKKGYLNGHTPFSAYLAFLSHTVATMYDFDRCVVSNERSANEGNIVYHDINIKHT